MNQKLEKEYLEFLGVGEVSPPQELNNKILNEVRLLIYPSISQVLFKTLKIFIFFSVLTLSICPQFGVGFIKDSHLFDFFMTFGHSTCKFLCGLFFLSASLFASTIFLSREEIKALKANAGLGINMLILLSLLALWLFGASFSATTLVYWTSGALLGAWTAVIARERLCGN
jgi:hypothetical protein